MVALLSFLKKSEVFIEHLFLWESDAVYSDELSSLFVTAPISAGKGKDFDSLDGSGVGNVRATAEVGEVALSVGSDVSVLKFADKLAFVGFSPISEHFERICF